MSDPLPCPHRGDPAGGLLGATLFACEHPAVAGPCIVEKLLPRNHPVASCQRCELRKGGTRPPRVGSVPLPNQQSAISNQQSSSSSLASQQADWFLQSCPPLPEGFPGQNGSVQGIVTAAGGAMLQLNAYVLFRLLRSLGCTLPIECWYAGARERDERFAELVAPLGVECRDAVAAGWIGHPLAGKVRWKSHHVYPPQSVHAYSLKPFALLQSRFAEALWIDADSHPARDPTGLFDVPQYRDAGALAWRDLAESHLAPNLACLDLAPPAAVEFGWETGQFLVDKRRHWRPLQLTHWLCANAPFFFQHFYGDKDCFFAAWLKTQATYALAKTPDYLPGKAVVQPDFAGVPLFYHRAGGIAKLKPGQPDPLTQFPLHDVVARALREYELATRHSPFTMHSGRTLILPEGDADVSTCLRQHGCWEPDVTAYLARVVQPGWQCVDVGANVGYFSILLADLVSANQQSAISNPQSSPGRVLAIEPLAECCAAIRASIAANDFGAVLEVINAAAADPTTTIGELRLNLHPTMLGVTTERRPHDWQAAEVRTVPAIGLDALLRDWPRVELIKLDIEGGEPGAIRGAAATIARHRPILLLEFVPRHCDDPAAWLAELTEIGPLRALAADGSTRAVLPAELLADANRLWMLEVIPS